MGLKCRATGVAKNEKDSRKSEILHDGYWSVSWTQLRVINKQISECAMHFALIRDGGMYAYRYRAFRQRREVLVEREQL